MKAKTISKALAKLLYKAGKVSAFSHTNFIILGGDILKEDATDVDIKIGRKLYVVEINTVDGEKDLNVLSKEEYIECYSSSRWED